jgi:hypothetical protein
MQAQLQTMMHVVAIVTLQTLFIAAASVMKQYIIVIQMWQILCDFIESQLCSLSCAPKMNPFYTEENIVVQQMKQCYFSERTSLAGSPPLAGSMGGSSTTLLSFMKSYSSSVVRTTCEANTLNHAANWNTASFNDGHSLPG